LGGDQSALDIAWCALTVGRDAKGLAIAKDGVILNVNAQVCQLLGWSRTSLIGTAVSGGLFKKPLPRHLRKAVARWKTLVVTKSGEKVPVEVTRQRLKIPIEKVEVYALRDLRVRRKEARKLRQKSSALHKRDVELQAQGLRFEMALRSLTQGVCVFDQDQRLVICNEPYLRMYELSPDEVKPGTTLLEILQQRVARGLFSGPSPEEFIRQRLATVMTRKPATHTHIFTDGRIVKIGHHPIAGGGWVASHEDVTEQQRLNARLEEQNRLLQDHERQLRTQNLHLDAALKNMSQGLCMFDEDGRLILCNEQYRQMYGLSESDVAAGTQLRQLLKRRRECGAFPNTGPTVDTYVEELLESLTKRKTLSKLTELDDGRFITVTNRAMPEGGWVATHQDVTELRKAERGLIAARAAAEHAAKEARGAHTLLLDAFEVVPEGLVLFDADDRYVLWNRRYGELYGERVKRGARFEEVLRAGLERGIYPDAVGREEDWLANRLARHGQPHNTHEHRLSSGRWVRVHERRTANGGAIGVRIDITELKQREEQLKAQNVLLDAALNNMSQGLVLFDRDRRVLICNRRYMEIYGLTPEQVKPGTPIRQLIQYRLAQGLKVASEPADYVRERVEGPVTPANAFQEFADGRIIAYAVRPMPDGGGVATHEDVTEQRRIEARIKHMAHHDALTDLPNRVLLRERLDEALKAGGPVAVLWLDLDRFKEVNDSLGHLVGDGLLKAAAERLQGCVRDNDIVARLGGDEFAIIQTGTSQPLSATSLALRTIEAISAPYQVSDHQIVVGASVGISVSPDDTSDPDQLLKNADLALYRAKSEGRGTYRFFEPGMDARMHARRMLELDLRSALATGAFELHYQPIVNLDSNRISAFEALLRWNHPRGSISPAEFIPLAEETGLISSIGAWVLRRACVQAASWPDAIRVAVNLSPMQFKNNDLVQLVRDALSDSGLLASRLELEITESVLLENTEHTLATLRELRALGVRISMDDFGTGFSSLSNLRSFSFDNIKIDRSFVQGLGQDEQCSAIVQAVAGLGAGLNLTTTAEGVETAEQLEWVRAFGIVDVQGFYLSRPVPAAKIDAVIASFEMKARSAA
jgi:diguanylate cyclase (GGDEF)-like protein/PAS domain S-box-containing protein